MTALNVPCVLVDNENFEKWWPYILKCVSSSDFISIDLELSGIGTKDIFGSQVDERYKLIKEVASTRSILSMGIACYKINSSKGYFQEKKAITNHEKFAYEQIFDCLDKDCGDFNADYEADNEDYHFTANVFNFLTLCHDEFTIDTRSMKFLVQQGFDLNELSLKGIPYYRGNDTLLEETGPSLRKLMSEIIAFKIPIVFHNGFFDLAFLYHNFYSELPIKLDTFVSDLFEMFPLGIFDTKFIAYSCGCNSYLEYLFNRSQRSNYFRKLNNQSSLKIIFDDFPSDSSSDVKYFDLSAKIMESSAKSNKICDNYAKYGWCSKLNLCENSHNIDLILDEELKSKKDKKSKQLVSHFKQVNNLNKDESDLQPVPFRKNGCHHSGNDAFMTGYYFLYYTVLKPKNKSTNNEFKSYFQNLSKFKNKIFLSGKVNPLNIMKSNFASTSKNHNEKIKKMHETQIEVKQ